MCTTTIPTPIVGGGERACVTTAFGRFPLRRGYRMCARARAETGYPPTGRELGRRARRGHSPPGMFVTKFSRRPTRPPVTRVRSKSSFVSCSRCPFRRRRRRRCRRRRRVRSRPNVLRLVVVVPTRSRALAGDSNPSVFNRVKRFFCLSSPLPHSSVYAHFGPS